MFYFIQIIVKLSKLYKWNSAQVTLAFLGIGFESHAMSFNHLSLIRNNLPMKNLLKGGNILLSLIWKLLVFGRKNCTSAILPLVLHGNLQNNPIRVCLFQSFLWWILFLVQIVVLDWVIALQSLCSNYKFLQEKFHTDQKMKDVSFVSSRRHSMESAFPGKRIFQWGETLVNILFVYASRCRLAIGYRQVMFQIVKLFVS